MRFNTTGFSKPWTPRWLARKISAVPPSAILRRIVYRACKLIRTDSIKHDPPPRATELLLCGRLPSTMAFCLRAFCRDFSAPSLSDLLVWLRQYETPATICGGRSAGDLLSTFWEEVLLCYDGAEAPLRVRCMRSTGDGSAAFAAEVGDF